LPSAPGVIFFTAVVHLAELRVHPEVEVHHPVVQAQIRHHARVGAAGVIVPVAAATGRLAVHRRGIDGHRRGVSVLAGHDHGRRLNELEAEPELVGLDVGQARDGALEEEVGGERAEDVERRDAVNGEHVGVGVVVQQHGHHVGAHHFRRHVQRGLPGGPRRVIDVGGSELQQRLDDLAAAVLDSVVQRERLVEVESLAHDHELDELDVGRVERATHAADLVVVVELRRCGRGLHRPRRVVVREERRAAGQRGLQAELVDLGDDVDGQVLGEHLRGEARLGDEVGAGGPELVQVLLPRRHENLHHVLDGRILHHASQLLLQHFNTVFSFALSSRAQCKRGEQAGMKHNMRWNIKGGQIRIR
jgi:hypothetical protein